MAAEGRYGLEKIASWCGSCTAAPLNSGWQYNCHPNNRRGWEGDGAEGRYGLEKIASWCGSCTAAPLNSGWQYNCHPNNRRGWEGDGAEGRYGLEKMSPTRQAKPGRTSSPVNWSFSVRVLMSAAER